MSRLDNDTNLSRKSLIFPRKKIKNKINLNIFTTFQPNSTDKLVSLEGAISCACVVENRIRFASKAHALN